MYSLTLVVALVVVAGLVFRTFIILPLQPFNGPLRDFDGHLRETSLRLETHIRNVASRPHNLDHYPALEDAARYIETTLVSFGAQPVSDPFDVNGRSVRNIEVIFKPRQQQSQQPQPQQHQGTAPLNASQSSTGTLVIGAHYDSAGDSPGSNDNGTGVAALLELARDLSQNSSELTTTVRLVFFVNEEHPYGKTDDMGSLRHARKMRDTGEPIMGMIALETLGYFSETPGSQRLPPPFNWIYPDRGNFVAFIGLPGARTFLAKALREFRTLQAFASTGTIAPGWIKGADLSDHWAYHREGFPALMITDTAPYRNPFYHQVWDLPDTVDYQSLARITDALCTMTRRLAGGV